jgi:hypothetical protein
MAPQERQLPGTRPTTLRRNAVDDISVRAGDRFFYAGTSRPSLDQETPHGCIDAGCTWASRVRMRTASTSRR